MCSQGESLKCVERDKKYIVPEGQKIPDWIVNEARLLNDALYKGVVEKVEGSVDFQDEGELVDIMKGLVDITYFVEMPNEWVKAEERGEKMMELFKQEVELENGKVGTLADRLAETGSALSIAMSTLDASTAEAIKFLNEKDVPVIAWVVLSDGEGYWTNPLNLENTKEKIQKIRKWKKDYNLNFDCYGFDLEKPLDVMRPIMNRDIFGFVKKWLGYNREAKKVFKKASPQESFEALLKSLSESGEGYEFYIAPKIALNILGTGLKPPKDAREIEMVYTSETPLSLGVSVLLSRNKIPAIGILNAKEGETPGRFDKSGAPALPKHHTPEETLRDIRQILKKRVNVGNREFDLADLYVFALNGRNVMSQTMQALNQAFEELKSKN